MSKYLKLYGKTKKQMMAESQESQSRFTEKLFQLATQPNKTMDTEEQKPKKYRWRRNRDAEMIVPDFVEERVVVPPKEIVTCKTCKLGKPKDEECPHCRLWGKRIKTLKVKKNRYVYPIVDHRCYFIADGQPTVLSGVRGHGGKLFLFEFKDGKQVSSTNVFNQGLIPRVFWKQLPDSAKIVDTFIK